MDSKTQVVLYVAATLALLGGGLFAYGSKWQHIGWALFFGVVVFAALVWAGLAFLPAPAP